MAEIVERSREDRFEELFREHYGAVRGYALRRAPGDLAQDAVSETFLVAWRRLDDVPADALPWLYGVARRVLANQRRSADRGSALERRLAATAGAMGSSDPGENAGEGEVLRTALARLSERDREALILVAWHELSGARAARAAGCTRGLRRSAASGARPARGAAGPAGVAGRPGGQPEVAGGALMRRHEALMERLADADPVRDREPLTPEEQHEADALLARLLATPVGPAAAPRRPRSRLRRRALVVAGAACAALAAFVAIDLVDSDAPGPGVVDRAVAAMTRAGSVYHVVELMTFRAEGTREAPQAFSFESWYTPDGRLHRKTFTVRDGKQGRLLEDFAGRRRRPDRANGSALQWDASSNTIGESGFAGGDLAYLGPFADPGSRLRTLREQGRLRMAGTTTVDGRRAYRLVSGRFAADKDTVSVEVTVDAETYLPLSQRLSLETAAGQKTETLTRYRAYERRALGDKTSGLLALDPHPGAKCSDRAHELTQGHDLGFPNPCAAGGREGGRKP